jgi:hypothetical protein
MTLSDEFPQLRIFHRRLPIGRIRPNAAGFPLFRALFHLMSSCMQRIRLKLSACFGVAIDNIEENSIM